jgi:hypothetical protein
VLLRLNFQSEQNLAFAGGRELSRAQMGHLQTNGEYRDSSHIRFMDAMLPTTGTVNEGQHFASIQEGQCEEEDCHEK